MSGEGWQVHVPGHGGATGWPVASRHHMASHWAQAHSQTGGGQDLNLKICITHMSSAQARASPRLFLPSPRQRTGHFPLPPGEQPVWLPCLLPQLPSSLVAYSVMLTLQAWQVSAGEAGRSHTDLTYRRKERTICNKSIKQQNKKDSISSHMSRRNLVGIFLDVESVVHDAFLGFPRVIRSLLKKLKATHYQ